MSHLHCRALGAELVYLSLGSNTGDRRTYLQSAIQRLHKAGIVKKVSAFYEAEPVELRDQPWFLNCVVGLETLLSPSELLKAVLNIEREMGRVRLQDKGPRSIDIDVVLFGDLVVEEVGLKIPHPAMHERRFVLAPLADVAPDAIHPRMGKTVRELLAALPEGQVVRRIDPGEREPIRAR